MSVSSSAQDRQASSAGSVRNKVVVVTGASGGLGLETAKQLASRGAEVVMICRNRARGEEARSQVARVATGRPPVLMLADLSVQADVRSVTDEVRGRYDRVDILINNAGSAFNQREQSADGIELTWATNHIAPFLLTELLLPLVVAAPAGRVVTVASEIYSKKLDPENLQGERKYSYFGAYRASKLGNVLFTRELARRIKDSGVTAVAVSPGPARTNFGGGGPRGVMGVVTNVMKHTPIFRPADEAAEGIVWAATTPALNGGNGGLYMRRKHLKLKGAAVDESLAGVIWTISERQAGIDSERSSVAAVSKGSRNHG
ncbi:MAG: SDR family NAD(P)-dependent oxidoreductase [Solirubrobacterales bacterium]|nr:SDR family NAD(P)-dependent oxidoreductase [Solirubrobacterales bacterium]